MSHFKGGSSRGKNSNTPGVEHAESCKLMMKGIPQSRIVLRRCQTQGPFLSRLGVPLTRLEHKRPFFA